MTDKRPNGASDLAMQLKRSQAAMMTLAAQREEANNKAAEARIELMLLVDENTALRMRIEKLEKQIVDLQEAGNKADGGQQSLALVDGAPASQIN
jgi:predicted  nucleic acid-binding Zn-ribbon protein